ncbi:hypothetical protein HDV04_002900 [Boothiomyces sp. JEL0838]|nr:hypothetical protein HDV04_002900 [Boothiomyces sp. JEL0838]
MVATEALESAKRTALISSYQKIVESVINLSGLPSYPEIETKHMGISIYDVNLECLEENTQDLNAFEKVLEPDADFDSRFKYLMEALSLLDPNNQFRPLIVDHPILSADDMEMELSESIPHSRLSNSCAVLYRVISLTAFSLGLSFVSVGNQKLGYHMLILAVMIHERIARTANRDKATIKSDANISRRMYQEITELAISIQDYDRAIEYGTKLVSRYDLIVAELLSDSTLEKSQIGEFIEFDHHYESLMLLAKAAEIAKDYRTAVSAYSQALELFSHEKRFGKEGSIIKHLLHLSGADSSEYSDEMIFKKSELEQLDICVKLVNNNEMGDLDPLKSLNYSRSAMEYFALAQGSQLDIQIKECHLQFLVGRMLYKFALSLAGMMYLIQGGVQLASSPPIAVLPPSPSTPSIKSLLEESLDMLEDAKSGADMGMEDSNCQEAIVAQVRLEDKAVECLKEIGMDARIISEWENARLNKTESSTHSHLETVVFSPQVIKRLKLLAPNDNPSPKLNLSRRRTFNIDAPAKVLCSYCSMQCANTDLKCEFCAQGRVFIWYCNEECKFDHASQHESVCLKNKDSLDSPLDMRVLQNLAETSLDSVKSSIDSTIVKPPEILGVLLSTYSIGIIVTPVVAYYSDKYQNRKIAMCSSSMVLFASILLIIFGKSIQALFIARMGQGIAGGVGWMVGFSILAESFPTNLGKIMGNVMTANTLGNLLGPPLGGFLYDNFGTMAPFYLCAGICLLDTCFRVFLPAPAISLDYQFKSDQGEHTGLLEQQPLGHTGKKSVGMWKLVTNLQMIVTLLAIIIAEGALTGIEPTLPLYLGNTFNLNTTSVGFIWMAISVPKMLACTLAGSLSDNYGRKAVTTLGLIVFASACPLVGYADSVELLSVGLALFGIGAGISLVPGVPEMADIARELGDNSFGTVYSLYNIASSTGMLLGPIAGSWAYTTYSFNFQLLFFCSCLVSSAIMVFLFAKVK